VVLRHQVAILRRGGRRPQYTAADRALLAAVSRLLPPERWLCFAVRPQTLRRWHRALLQGNRRGRGRRPGRPPLAAETRSLILRLARENPRWGYVRIQGELLKLGISVSATTVATVLRVSGLGPAPRRIGPSWSEFLRAQAQSMLGAGLSWEPAGGLEGNESARSAPIREAALDVEDEEVSTNGAEEWSSRSVQGLPRLSAVAAVPSPSDSTAAPLRSSQQWHARDGPRTRRRSLHARTVRTGRQPRRLLAPGPRVATTGQVASRAAARVFTRAAQHNGPNTASTRQLNRVSLPHRFPTTCTTCETLRAPKLGFVGRTRLICRRNRINAPRTVKRPSSAAGDSPTSCALARGHPRPPQLPQRRSTSVQGLDLHP
jgi:Homeodomain-like domain